MSKINITTDDLVSNIIGANLNEKQPTLDREKFEENNYKEEKRMNFEKLKDPKPITINLENETLLRLKKYKLNEELKNNKSFKISELGRELFEKWVEKNCEPL